MAFQNSALGFGSKTVTSKAGYILFSFTINPCVLDIAPEVCEEAWL